MLMKINDMYARVGFTICTQIHEQQAGLWVSDFSFDNLLVHTRFMILSSITHMIIVVKTQT